MKRFCTIALMFMFVSACNNSNSIPADIIKPGQMQNIFWDMIRGDLLAKEIVKKDSAQNIESATSRITEKIFSIHNVDRAKFEKSLAFYEKHPAIMKTIFDSLSAIQTRKNFSEMEKKRNPGKDRRFSRSNVKP